MSLLIAIKYKIIQADDKTGSAEMRKYGTQRNIHGTNRGRVPGSHELYQSVDERPSAERCGSGDRPASKFPHNESDVYQELMHKRRWVTTLSQRHHRTQHVRNNNFIQKSTLLLLLLFIMIH